jgi:muramoyltetrapeptide carboxypeptidase
VQGEPVQPPSALVMPPLLARGAAVRVVAPAGPFDANLVWRAMGWLAERYEVRYDRAIFERKGYLAGSDDRRRAELSRALAEPGVGAIFCARGGYGASRIVHAIDWQALRAAPRWLVGFSDFTACHLEAAAVGVASIHGPNMTGLGRGDGWARARLLELLERPATTRHAPLTVLAPGSAGGPLFGGNLTLIHAAAAAGRLVVPKGAVLLLEEVGERSYRIDRMLTTLIVGEHLREVAAVVIGELDRCDGSPSALDVMAERLATLGVPVVAGVPVGHGVRNDPLRLGCRAFVEASADERGAGGSLVVGPAP